MKYKVGDVFLFDKCEVTYWQDLRPHNGCIKGKPFELVHIITVGNKHTYKLVAEGYGHKKHYGNGAIYVGEKEMSTATAETNQKQTRKIKDELRTLRHKHLSKAYCQICQAKRCRP